jgi:hypothetical protein
MEFEPLRPQSDGISRFRVSPGLVRPSHGLYDPGWLLVTWLQTHGTPGFWSMCLERLAEAAADCPAGRARLYVVGFKSPIAGIRPGMFWHRYARPRGKRYRFAHRQFFLAVPGENVLPVERISPWLIPKA